MQSTLKYLALAAALALPAGISEAATVGTISNVAYNDGVDDIYGVSSRSGFYNAALYLTGSAQIDVQYFGAEAGYANQFLWGSTVLFTTAGEAITGSQYGLTYTTALQSAGLLTFSFLANSNALDGVVNGSANDPNAGPSYFVSLGDPSTSNGSANSGTVAWLWFDDNAPGDDNHDDMVIRLSISQGSFVAPVPVPAALPLLAGGIGVLAMIRRRKRAA